MKRESRGGKERDRGKLDRQRRGVERRGEERRGEERRGEERTQMNAEQQCECLEGRSMSLV